MVGAAGVGRHAQDGEAALVVRVGRAVAANAQGAVGDGEHDDLARVGRDRDRIVVGVVGAGADARVVLEVVAEVVDLVERALRPQVDALAANRRAEHDERFAVGADVEPALEGRVAVLPVGVLGGREQGHQKLGVAGIVEVDPPDLILAAGSVAAGALRVIDVSPGEGEVRLVLEDEALELDVEAVVHQADLEVEEALFVRGRRVDPDEGQRVVHEAAELAVDAVGLGQERGQVEGLGLLDRLHHEEIEVGLALGGLGTKHAPAVAEDPQEVVVGVAVGARQRVAVGGARLGAALVGPGARIPGALAAGGVAGLVSAAVAAVTIPASGDQQGRRHGHHQHPLRSLDHGENRTGRPVRESTPALCGRGRSLARDPI